MLELLELRWFKALVERRALTDEERDSIIGSLDIQKIESA